MEYMNNITKKTMSVKEFSYEYGIGENMAYELVHSEDFPKILCGRRIIIIRSKIDEWFENQIGNTFNINRGEFSGIK